jgi:hypothetical protein
MQKMRGDLSRARHHDEERQTFDRPSQMYYLFLLSGILPRRRDESPPPLDRPFDQSEKGLTFFPLLRINVTYQSPVSALRKRGKRQRKRKRSTLGFFS